MYITYIYTCISTTHIVSNPYLEHSKYLSIGRDKVLYI